MELLRAIRNEEFSRLRENEHIYLDYAGSALYSERHVLETTRDLMSGVYGNPHSGRGNQMLPAGKSSSLVARMRSRVLKHFRASDDEYCVVFTSGATAALKLVGENFPFTEASSLVYASSCHNSVEGMREFSTKHGASVSRVDFGIGSTLEELFDEVRPVAAAAVAASSRSTLDTGETGGYHLVVCPAECNWSGTKFDLSSTRMQKKPNNCFVVVDASKFLQNDMLELCEEGCPADFVVCSFYKMFGYPTGLGALIARKEAASLLLKKRTYFGGGTVLDAGRSGPGSHVLKPAPDGLEDGTANFLGMIALKRGFELVDRMPGGNLQVARKHAFDLAQYLYFSLKSLKHKQSQLPVCRMYSIGHETKDIEKQGPIVTFNIQFPSGKPVGHSVVEAAMIRHGIQVRSGCFCSPGACEQYMPHMDRAEAESQYKEHGHTCGGGMDLIDGKPTGAVRISIGWTNTRSEINVVLAVIRQNFMGVQNAVSLARASMLEENNCVEKSGMATMLQRAGKALEDVCKASKRELTVGSWVGTVFDDNVAKITRIYKPRRGDRDLPTFDLLFEDGFEMPGVERKSIVVLSERASGSSTVTASTCSDVVAAASRKGSESAADQLSLAGSNNLDPAKIMALLQNSTEELELFVQAGKAGEV